MAITDHNTGDYVDVAVEAASKLRIAGTAQVVVLPGVELTVEPGIHVVVILPSGGTDGINDLLSAVEVTPEMRGKQDTLVKQSIFDVAREVHSRNGFLIAAHNHSSSGLVEIVKGVTRDKMLEVVDALEYKPETQGLETKQAYVRETLNCKLPFVYGSDLHGENPETPPMWLKLADVSLNGVRQIKFEVDARISKEPPTLPSHPQIIACTTSGGIFKNDIFKFSAHLNVVIGAGVLASLL